MHSTFRSSDELKWRFECLNSDIAKILVEVFEGSTTSQAREPVDSHYEMILTETILCLKQM